MASPSIDPLRHPVRVLIRTRPTHLQKIHSSFDQADTKLIEKLRVQLSGKTDTIEIRHLITRIADEKGSERVDIVFDYGVPADECQPEVVAFKVRIDDSRLIITQLLHPRIKPRVNDTVDWWRGINLKNHITFPSRTDVRRKRRGLGVASR
ncbi:hypothetical protein K432DRAFT_386676, partial [Lepidopterella palustris CBS 459.81]